MRKFSNRSQTGLTVLTVSLLTALAVSVTGCNVTRTIVTKSEYTQDGETKTVIESRTVESYDASKKINLF